MRGAVDELDWMAISRRFEAEKCAPSVGGVPTSARGVPMESRAKAFLEFADTILGGLGVMGREHAVSEGVFSDFLRGELDVSRSRRERCLASSSTPADPLPIMATRTFTMKSNS
jgi:hypothetical protein